MANHHSNDCFEIPWVEERSDLYVAGIIPHVRIDGKFAIRGAPNCTWAAAQYRTAIQQRLAETQALSPIAIGGAYFVAADSVQVAATFTLLDPVALSDTRGFLLMLVDNLYWGPTRFDHVTQGASEQDLLLTQPDDQVTMAAAFARQPTWDADDIHCLAFFQCMSESLEVHQVAWLTSIASWVAEDPAAGGRDWMWASPNPFAASRGTLRIGLIGDAGHSASMAPPGIPAWRALRLVEILDTQGRLIAQIGCDPSAAAGHVAQWDGRDGHGCPVPAGAYWVRTRGGRTAAATRVVLLR